MELVNLEQEVVKDFDVLSFANLVSTELNKHTGSESLAPASVVGYSVTSPSINQSIVDRPISLLLMN